LKKETWQKNHGNCKELVFLLKDKRLLNWPVRTVTVEERSSILNSNAVRGKGDRGGNIG